MEKCHICGSETDWKCEQCDEFVCEKCTVPYNQFNQIDYTLCIICDSVEKESFIYDREKEIEYEAKKENERIFRNQKQKIYYHSDKAIEKRRLKKIERQKREEEFREKRSKLISDIFKNMF